jgi:hypothetical protein
MRQTARRSLSVEYARVRAVNGHNNQGLVVLAVS